MQRRERNESFSRKRTRRMNPKYLCSVNFTWLFVLSSEWNRLFSAPTLNSFQRRCDDLLSFEIIVLRCLIVFSCRFSQFRSETRSIFGAKRRPLILFLSIKVRVFLSPRRSYSHSALTDVFQCKMEQNHSSPNRRIAIDERW